MTDFPDFIIRGIPNKDNYNEADDFVSVKFFLPDERTSQNRADNGEALSIHWEDNDLVTDFTLKLRNDKGLIAFPIGYVRFPRNEIDYTNSKDRTRNTLSYERDQKTDNPYHGNIVYRANLSRPLKNTIASCLLSSAFVFTNTPKK